MIMQQVYSPSQVKDTVSAAVARLDIVLDVLEEVPVDGAEGSGQADALVPRAPPVRKVIRRLVGAKQNEGNLVLRLGKQLQSSKANRFSLD